jgi:hypothetical protein
MSPGKPTTPARPPRLTVKLEQAGDRLSLTCRRRELFGGCFMLLWLIGWTVGCVFLAGAVITQRSLFMLLFAIPFWAAWVFVVCQMLSSFFGVETLEFDRDGVRYVRRVLVPIRRRDIPLAEIRGFGAYVETADSDTGRPTRGIEVQTTGTPLRFGDHIPDVERHWLRTQLEEHRALLEPEWARVSERPPVREPSVSDGQADLDTREDLEEQAPESAVVLTPAAQPLTPPSDSRWQRRDDFDEMAFLNRGRLGCGGLGGLLFINAFWNGIVSVFIVALFTDAVQKPTGAMWWGMLVFLIPFEVIGLVMLAALVAALAEPFRRTTWSFGRGEVRWRRAWLGVGRTRTYPVTFFDRVELRTADSESTSPRTHSNVARAGDAGRSHRLVFVEQSGNELFTIRNLTDGEARWIADAVQRERPLWFH